MVSRPVSPPAPPPTIPDSSHPSKEYIYGGGKLIATEAGNTTPSVSIASPGAAAVISAPATFAINADAADSDGTIAKVDFYNGATLLGTSTTSPYSYTWSNVSAGNYSLTAQATDNLGAITASSAVSITVNSLPSVGLTSPSSGTIFTSPANITFSASASDSDGSISKVEFYQGATLLGASTSGPYSYTWTNVSAGTYSITAKATDNLGGATDSSAVSVIVDTPPAVSITSPTGGITFDAPATVNIVASASDSDGTIGKVEFFNGSTKLGEDTTAPYAFNWANVPHANYVLTAVATDSLGLQTTSDSVSIVVNEPPSVAIANPPSGSVVTTPANLTISANAADSDGSISKVDFYRGTTLLGTSTASPYSYAWNNVSAGTYSLTAKATDNLGAVTTSAAISVTVDNPPSVSVTSPANGAVITAPANISINASASDSDGSINKVDFYQGATLLGTTTTSPYSFTWSNVSAGTYSLTAKATDNVGVVTTSSSVSITVNNSPSVSITSPGTGTVLTPPANVTINASASDSDGSISKVEFFNGATLLSTSTTSPYSYTWSNVSAGTYSITAKATDNLGAVTTSSAVAVTVDNPPTVSISGPTGGSAFTAPATVSISASASDTDGSISKVDFYNGATLIGTDTSSPYSYSWTSVPAGSYSLTAKATDNLGVVTTSSAVSITVNNPPSVSITAPTTGSVFTPPASIVINASAADTDGSITKVDFYYAATLLGTGTTSPYSFTWNNVSAGTYSLTAQATDNLGAITTSSAISVTVENPPTSSITSPASGSVFQPSATVTINAAAADSDGTITKVEFYQSATKLGEDTTAPYSFDWTNVPSGSYSLTAKAFDNLGASTTSAAISIRVNTPPAVTLTSPTSGSTVAAGSNLVLSAAASDADGTIAKVEFFQGATKLGESTSAPFNYTWSNVPTGAYNLTAKATDNDGAITTSAVVDITANLMVANSGFEVPALSPTAYQYNPLGGSWSFAGTGVTTNNSGFTYGNPVAPEGNQAAFLQGAGGTISQSISGFQANVSYSIRFLAAQRGNCCSAGGQDFQVFLDTNLLGTFRPTGFPYVDYSTNTFTATAGAHTLKFQGLNSLGGDNTAFIDNVRIMDQSGSGAPISGQVAYWKLDDNYGTTAADSSGSGHQGTMVNGPAWSTGKLGASMYFDGVDDMLATNGIADVTNNFTLSFWALPSATHEIDYESAAGYGGTFGQRYAFWPNWYDSGHCGAGVSIGTNGISVYEHASDYMPARLVYQTTITDWTYVTIVYENKQPKLYVNGVLVRTGSASTMSYVHMNPGYIGGQVYGYYAGRLDEVQVYNRALSANEVNTLASSSGVPQLNLALGKTATQSSVYGGGTPDRAVDGNTEGNWAYNSVTHTDSQAQPWWQVDLGSVRSVQSVEVWNRTDCCSDRLTNFNVLLLDSNQAVIATRNVPGQGGTPTTVQISGAARYVKVQLVGAGVLSLAEVKVWGPTPYNGTPISIPGTIEVENYDYGVSDIAYHDTSAGTHGQDYDQPPNYPPPSYRQPTDVDLYKSASNYSNGYLIVMQAGDWMNYSVNVTQAGSYTVYPRVAWGGTSGGLFHIEVDGVDRTGPIQIPDTGWSLALISKSGIQLTAGQHVLRVVADTNASNGCMGDIDYLYFRRDGPLNYSVNFDGSSGRVNIPFSSSLNITGPITVEGWFKVNNNNTTQPIAGNQSGVGGYLLLANQGMAQLYITNHPGLNDFAISWPPNISAGVWHHMAGVFDGNQIRVYLDGVLCAATNTTVAPGPENNTGLSIGNSPWWPFNGWIDEVRVSTGALYTSNFTPEKHLTATGSTKGLWKFDGQSLQDSSGYGNHGTFAGGATFSTSVP